MLNNNSQIIILNLNNNFNLNNFIVENIKQKVHYQKQKRIFYQELRILKRLLFLIDYLDLKELENKINRIKLNNNYNFWLKILLILDIVKDYLELELLKQKRKILKSIKQRPKIYNRLDYCPYCGFKLNKTKMFCQNHQCSAVLVSDESLSDIDRQVSELLFKYEISLKYIKNLQNILQL